LDVRYQAMNERCVTTHPLTPDRWPDLTALFDTSATPRACWCMWFRETTAGYRANAGAANKRAFQRIVNTSAAPPGVIAYVDGQPAGWCAVAPREQYPRLQRSRTARPIDDQPVWAVTCFFIASKARRSGLGHALLRAAVDLAGAHGARIVEGYPLMPGRKLRSDEAYVGVSSLFKKVGFLIAARPSERRAIMRYTIPKAASK
jgi:GNAT superfamily N-acetyltransferase